MPRFAAGLALGAARGAAEHGVVIQVHSLLNIPDMDPHMGDDVVSDAYLKLQILTERGEPFGPAQKTTVFDDVHEAVFGECYHTFRVPENLEGAVLRVKAYDKDNLAKDDKIAHLDINLLDLMKPHSENRQASATAFTDRFLAKERVFQTRRMEMDTKRRGLIKDEPVSIRLRLIPKKEFATRSPTRRFFLIRHGESLWNEAQDEKKVMGLLKFDHGLNRVGIDQCKELNAAWREADVKTLTPLEREFISCPLILCSPLTRCVQTALLSLHSHKTLLRNGMMLQRNLREVKSSLGSLDTVGVEVGAQNIKNRAKDCLLKACRDTEKPSLKCSARESYGPPPLTEAEIGALVDPVELHANDAASKWWTSRGLYENEKGLRSRTNALMGTLRYLPADSAILVGHSLLFRAIMKFCLADDFGGDGPTRKDLSSRKMGNAAVVAVDVAFPAFPEEDNYFEISRVEFLFGSGLAEE